MSLKLAHSKQQRDASFQKAMADLQASFKSTSVAALAAESLQRMRAPVAAGALDLLDDSPAVFRAALSESLQDWTPPTAEEVERAQTEHDEQMMLEIGRAAAERLRTEQQAVKKRDELLERQTAAMEALAAQSVLPRAGNPAESKEAETKPSKGAAKRPQDGVLKKACPQWLAQKLRSINLMDCIAKGAESCGDAFVPGVDYSASCLVEVLVDLNVISPDADKKRMGAALREYFDDKDWKSREPANNDVVKTLVKHFREGEKILKGPDEKRAGEIRKSFNVVY
ncbi:MAG: hypothetical protein H6948_06540 [Zoogloeaceae bacterium]|nr:hypothetical protein [Zoogloeaceae bacterium]